MIEKVWDSLITVDDLGRVLIPKELRKELGIKVGDRLEVMQMTSVSVLGNRSGVAFFPINETR